MWSAFMNGSGLHGGGGAGGGYVPSQGWEFVPGSGMERTGRGRGKKSRSPLRRISSPPAVFSQMYEPQFGGASPGGGGGGGGGGGEGEGGTGAAQLEVLRGQMWPCPGQPQQQQTQTQHTRLKKKFEDLKKRHTHDKEEWMREKESLLREVADIQGGENRRILLDLKTVLEEVQAEVKREEEKRSELQLLYTRDRCAWDLEKTELQCRIAQLEARERAAELGGGGVQSAGSGSVVLRNNQEPRGETSTLRREREEQRRLLADTHSTAMDLRCRLEHNERDWSREKAELLEKFDVERREWESQLKDMQKKIEELYCEVRVKRKGTGLDTGRQEEHHRLSIRSTSTGSSLLSDNSHSEPLSSSSQSEPSRHPTLPSFGRTSNISGSGGRDGQQSTCFQAESLCGFNVGGQFTQNERVRAEPVDELRSRGCWEQFPDSKEVMDTSELESIFCGGRGCGVVPKNVSEENEKNALIDTQESPLWAELSYSSSKKKNIIALNAALMEIARVSEELCSYQDDIRKKSVDKRIRSESLCLPEEREVLLGKDKTELELDKESCDLSQIYYDLRALETENWITLSPDNTWRASMGPDESWRLSTTDPDSCRDTQTSSDVLSETDTAAPPIPPRSSSRNLSAPTHPDPELHIADSPMTTVRRCHSPCVLVDRKCSSPSIVRKFEAMLQENEGKVLIDGMVASCAVPANPKCNIGCCHNRWSCDASKFTNSKPSAYGSVQKSYSEANILSAGRDLRSDYNPAVGNLQSPELQMPPIVKDLPVELILSSLEITPVSPNPQGSRRNIMLEQKTAEFNRTLFQAEMGRGVEEQDGFTVTDVCAVGCQPAPSASCASDEVLLPRESRFQPHRTDVTARDMGAHPEVTLPPPTMYGHPQNSEVQLRQRKCGGDVQKVRLKQEIPSGLSPEVSHADIREATTAPSQSPAHHPEVKHKASSPSRKTPHRAATEAPFSESVLHGNTHPGQSVVASSSKNENPHGAKPQPAKVAGSLQQTSAENKQRQMTQPAHQAQPKHASVSPSPSDSSRPGPRIMTDHPWKPLTLAAYPRPEGSRSNYGAVERILKNYESAARAQQNQSQQSEKTSSPNLSVKQAENTTELDMLDMRPLPLRHTQPSHTSQTHNAHTQLSSHSVMGMTEIQLTVQDKEESCLTSSSSVQKNFSRPARPANRRLPSRWASRSPTSSSSTSSSPSTTPVIPPSFPLQKHTPSFTYSHAFHIETVII